MKPINKTVPPVKAANENAAALAVIIGVLAEAIENNRELTRFAADKEINQQLDGELIELEAALEWTKENAACPVKPANLSAVPVDDLIMELQRRKTELAFVAVTPLDLSDYWGTDDSGEPLPTNQLPTPEAWSMAVRAFDRCLDGGAFTELMESMGDAWAAHEKKKGESK
jgi:hypothetical protein